MIVFEGRKGRQVLRVVAIDFGDGSIYRFGFITAEDLTAKHATAFQRTTYSFRRISAAEAGAIKPLRIRIHKVAEGETAQRIAARFPAGDRSLERFLVLNGLTSPSQLESGSLVKIIGE